MALYRISGVWKNTDRIITHYAIHSEIGNGVTRAKKLLKDDVIRLLSSDENIANTWIWDYREAKWCIGEKVKVVNGINGKYLRSNPDNTTTDNLEHLIDFDWIAP